MTHLFAIDQGTTPTRALVFSETLDVLAIAQKEFPQRYPHPGWVEYDPEDGTRCGEGSVAPYPGPATAKPERRSGTQERRREAAF